MRKRLELLLLLSAVILLPLPSGSSAEAAAKEYTVTAKSTPSKKYMAYDTYNEYTRYYYVFKEILAACEKNGGGTITVLKGTYIITNTLNIPSNVTITLEDGVILRKGTETGTSKLTASNYIFQFIKPSKSKSKGYYKKYDGEKNIELIGKGNASIDLNNVKSAIALIMGHNQNISISGITFKNMNAGHFIELDASENVTITDCSFLDSIQSPKRNKEAINIDTPDALTKGFNHAWSSQDKTPDLNITIDNCTFKNIDCAIGTHCYSQEQDAQGSYVKNLYHTGIKITDCSFYDMRSYVFDVINWKNVEISNCEISGGSYARDTYPYTVYNTVMRLKGVDNFTFKNNTCSNVGSIVTTFYIFPTAGDYNEHYIDLEFKLTPDNVKDLIYNNSYKDTKYFLISTCPLKPGSISLDEAYAKYIRYGGGGNTPNDYISIFVGLDYKTSDELKAEEAGK